MPCAHGDRHDHEARAALLRQERPDDEATDSCRVVAILLAGLMFPYFVWDNYLYIYRYGNDLKGDWASAAASLVFVVPFAIVLWYMEVRLDFDTEDHIGWGLVPFAMLLALKMNTARHLLIVYLVPDKRGIRNGRGRDRAGVPVPLSVARRVRFRAADQHICPLHRAGLLPGPDRWDVASDDFRHPGRTAKMIVNGVSRGSVVRNPDVADERPVS